MNYFVEPLPKDSNCWHILLFPQSKVSIVSKDACLAVYDPISKNFISDKQICAGTEKSDSCSGDSGGPMLSNKFGPYAVVGITSFGVKCKDPTFPGANFTIHLWRKHSKKLDRFTWKI